MPLALLRLGGFRLYPEDVQEVAEICDRVVGHAVHVGLVALIRIEHHGLQAASRAPKMSRCMSLPT